MEMECDDMKRNKLMMQYFEWYLDDDGSLWNNLRKDAKHLKEMGVTAVWTPPAYKGMHPDDVGYAVYDLYDLGEFNQKGSIRTKYGTKEEYLAAIEALHAEGIAVYADVVLNHKTGADETERFPAFEVDPNNRQEKQTEPYEIESGTKFTFPGRGDTYSDFKWSWEHFTGVDFNNATGKKAIYMIKGLNKGWAENASVDNQYGNYDYLMCADIDYKHPDVIKEIKRWADWYITETGVDGFRLDAIKHINYPFIQDLVETIRTEHGKDFYIVGEYWKYEYDSTEAYLEATDFILDLFDVALHQNLHTASEQGKDYDLRNVFDQTIAKKNPNHAVTFVDNHDSQPTQSLQSYVGQWFSPLAYGLILLRSQGFPCLFYGDYYGIKGPNPIEGQAEILDKLLYLRANHAYGEQHDYFNQPNCVGWTRLGDNDYPHGLAAILSNDKDGSETMYVGKQNAGQIFRDYMDNCPGKVKIDADGIGNFPVKARSISVWIDEKNITTDF